MSRRFTETMDPKQFPAGPPQVKSAPAGDSAAREVAGVEAFIFDMDGTMIDSMPHHSSTWLDFARRHEVAMDIDELMRRTTGRTGLECVRLILDEPEMEEARAWALVHEKEQLYRDIFGPIFKEVDGFSAFLAATRARGLKVGVGTAGDIHNVEFALGHLRMPTPPDAIGRGDEGLTGKPTPAIFLAVAERMGVAPARCIVFEDAPFGIEAARRAGMRAVGICTTNTPAELSGPHVIATVRDFNELIQSNFLETLQYA